MTNHVLGVDISKASLDVHLVPTGETQQFANNTVGFRRLIAWLRGRPVGLVVYEPTGAWHRDFERVLGNAGLPCHESIRCRHGVLRKHWAKAKTDAVDARMLAAMAKCLTCPAPDHPSQWQSELRELHTARLALAKDRTATQNRQKQACLPLVKRQCASRLRHIERRLKALEAEMLKHIKADSAQARALEILTSIPGIGAITAVAVLAEMPEIGSLDSKAAASLAGLAPVTRQSGTWQGHSFVQGGRRRLRQTLYMPAVSAISCNPDLARKYRQLCSAGKPPKVAITAVMRKLLLLANAADSKGQNVGCCCTDTPVRGAIAKGEYEPFEDGLAGATKCRVDNRVTQAATGRGPEKPLSAVT